MIGMRTRAPKSSEGKMGNGRETLRLRSKGAATVQEVVSPTGEKATYVGPSSGFVCELGKNTRIQEYRNIFTVDKTLL